MNIVPEPLIPSEDQLELMRLARAAQGGNLRAAAELTPLIQRLAGNTEVPMQQLTADPPADEGPPIVIVEAPDETPPESIVRSLAFTRQSLQIEATMQRCHNCGENHRTWQCPAIRQALFEPKTPTERPWYDVELGRELCRMKWHNFRGFVALLLSVPTEHLVIYAASYQAFIRTHNDQTTLTINQILQAWANDMRRGGDRGPAAPALRMVA